MNSVNFDGAGSFKFLLFTDLDANHTSGNEIAVWKNDDNAPVNMNAPVSAMPLLVNKGLYALNLGDTGQAALPASLDPAAGRRLYLRIWFDNGVNGLQQLTPDQEMAAVPFARHAVSVQGIGIGNGGLSWGFDAQAPSDYATAFGFMVDATGVNSTAWGNRTLASQAQATAWGMMTEASGFRSTAFGTSTAASATGATAWGANTLASGETATAWGGFTDATGLSATAWGSNTLASGAGSTAWGYFNIAAGGYSTAWGYYTTAPSFAETALGRYNTSYPVNSPGSWNAADRLLVIGNGSSDLNRADALVMLKNGNTTLNGSLTINGGIHLTGPVTGGTAWPPQLAQIGAANVFAEDLTTQGSFKYATAKTSKVRVHARAFAPGNRFTARDVSYVVGKGHLYLENTPTGTAVFNAGVHLPAGAVIVKVSLHYMDNQSGGVNGDDNFDASLALRYFDQVTDIEDAVATVPLVTTGTSNTIQVQEVTVPGGHTVSADSAYGLQFIMTDCSGLNLRFYGATIEYQTTTVQP